MGVTKPYEFIGFGAMDWVSARVPPSGLASDRLGLDLASSPLSPVPGGRPDVFPSRLAVDA